MDLMTVKHPGGEQAGAAKALAFDVQLSDDQDFAVFVAARSRRLLHAGDLLTGDRAPAEDLVQQALARAYLRWGSIRGGNPEAYVRNAMLNAYLDWWRRLRWRELPESAAAHGPVGEDLAVDVVRRDAVRQALAVLTRKERAVIVLRYWFDLSEAQIADELNIAPGTVKSTAARALKRLRGSEHVGPSAADEDLPDLCSTTREPCHERHSCSEPRLRRPGSAGPRRTSPSAGTPDAPGTTRRRGSDRRAWCWCRHRRAVPLRSAG